MNLIKITTVLSLACVIQFNAYAQDNLQITKSLMDDYEKYSQNNPFVLSPGSTINEKDFLPKNYKEVSMKVEIFKNDKQILLSEIDVPNSTYMKIFKGNSLNKNSSENETSKLHNGAILIAENKDNETQVNSFEVGIIVNLKKNSNLMVSQLWLEQENNKVVGNNKSIKPPKEKQPIGAEISLSPNVDRFLKEITLNHNKNSKSVTFFEDYKIELTPL